jgi:hypothetical protein
MVPSSGDGLENLRLMVRFVRFNSGSDHGTVRHQKLITSYVHHLSQAQTMTTGRIQTLAADVAI